MQRDKEHLNVDLGFLDEAKPREAQAQASSTYKVNWRNIAVIGGLVLVFFIWIASSDNAPSRRSAPASGTLPSTYQPQKPVYEPNPFDQINDQDPEPAPRANSFTNTNNGQFRCSSYDSNQADLMAPKNEFELTFEQQQLERQRDALNSLKLQIDLSGVTQYSDQASINSYNILVSQYNEQLSSFKAGSLSYQTRVDTYNQQVQARNNYLLTHCRRSR